METNDWRQTKQQKRNNFVENSKFLDEIRFFRRLETFDWDYEAREVLLSTLSRNDRPRIASIYYDLSQHKSHRNWQNWVHYDRFESEHQHRLGLKWKQKQKLSVVWVAKNKIKLENPSDEMKNRNWRMKSPFCEVKSCLNRKTNH